jgi:hypothetical protein
VRRLQSLAWLSRHCLHGSCVDKDKNKDDKEVDRQGDDCYTGFMLFEEVG